jgi:hypothetical protein
MIAKTATPIRTSFTWPPLSTARTPESACGCTAFHGMPGWRLLLTFDELGSQGGVYTLKRNSTLDVCCR